jgi:hypothetical protein
VRKTLALNRRTQHPCTDSTCPWSHSDAILPAVPYSAHHLSWLHIIRLFLCPACGPGRHPVVCLLVGFEDPPQGIPVATRTGCWLNMVAAATLFLCCVCPTPSPLTPPLPPRHTYSTPSSAGFTTTMHSLDGSHASCLLCHHGFSL